MITLMVSSGLVPKTSMSIQSIIDMIVPCRFGTSGASLGTNLSLAATPIIGGNTIANPQLCMVYGSCTGSSFAGATSFIYEFQILMPYAHAVTRLLL